MTVRFIDSFDHYPTADILKKYILYNGNPTIGAAGTGRNGTACANFQGGDYFWLPTFDNQTTWYVGFAFMWTSTLQAGVTAPVRFLDNTTLQCDLRVVTGNYLRFYTNGVAIGSIGTTQLLQNQWYYLEVKVVIHGSAGEASLRINGNPELTQTGLDTYNSGNVSASNLTVGNTGSGTFKMDDLYVADGNDSQTWLGDVRVQALQPNGVGQYSQWTSSSANPNWQNVDDEASVALADTDYNSTSTALNKDTFTFTDLAASSAGVYAVQHMIGVRKDDAGTAAIAPMVRQNDTDSVSATTFSVNDSYLYVRLVQPTNPVTTAAWTVADVNTNAQFGYRLES